MGGHAAEREPVDGVDDGFQPADVRPGAKAEVRTLRIPSADDAVAVLDGTLLPRSVCSCVVHVASENGFHRLRVEELAPVVGRDGLHVLEQSAPFHPLQGAYHGILRYALDEFDEVFACASVDEDKQTADAAEARDDSVHLEMPRLAPVIRLLWPVLHLETSGHGPCRMRFRSLAFLL